MKRNQVSMLHVFSRVAGAVLLPKKMLRALPCLLLAGCVSQTPEHAVHEQFEEQLPEHQLADFLLTDCGNIWSLTGQAFDTNPLFWLRSMDCAGRLAPAEARAEARVWPDDTWQDAFKRGILLSSAKITPLERRENITRLDVLSPQIPAPVRPLYQLWRDGQTSQLQLAEERGRYGKLQQSTDAELDTLRQQQQFLREQLDTTTRKLENLTDIERRLSSRKPAGNDLPDSARPARTETKQEDAKP
ncbi:two-component system QseEF-associated lipoprotein QseG [Phytobacter sp. RSE-02]|uniref:two-component system QseEF-associated lipoprotein QseG n=1 Tax=Phytobacter sp. RSE-02 TaxID=3229229 RepID=UPI00339D5749